MDFPGKSVLKDIVYMLRRTFLPWRNKGRAVVLAYHSVSDDGDRFSVTPREFAWQLGELRRQGFSIVSVEGLERMLDAGSVPPRTVVLTFDDGRRDNYAQVFPLLREHNIPIAIFLVTGSIGSRLPERVASTDALTADEIQEMAASGLITFGAHSVSHPKLTHIPEEKAKEELADSKAAVERLLGTSCDYVAYPYGRVNDAVERAAHAAGYTLAFATVPGTVGPDASRYRIPRNGIDTTVTRAQFRGIIAHGCL